MFRRSRFRDNFTGALLDPRGDGSDQQTSTTTLVASGHYRVESSGLLPSQVLEFGYEGRYDLGDNRMWRVRRDGQIPYDVVFDQELALTRVSAYALAELTFTPWLGAELGLRSDTFGYDVLDRDHEASDREGERLPVQSVNAWGTNVQPRATLSVGPFSGLSWLTSFGIGSRSSDAAALSEGELAPFTRIWAGESGLVHRLHGARMTSDLRSAFFYAYVDRDLLFDETRGRNVPLGPTNRYGAYVHGRLNVTHRFDTSASFTWAEAHAPPQGTSFAFAEGPRLPFVPRFVARADASLHESVATRWDPVGLHAGLGTSWISPRPLPLGVESRPIFSLDVALRARFRGFALALEGTNLTDRQNRSSEFFYASDFGTGGPTQRRVRHFSAAPPRQFLATLSVSFDPTPEKEDGP
jgi:outer membrane receptor protein involved in Fe transport